MKCNPCTKKNPLPFDLNPLWFAGLASQGLLFIFQYFGNSIFSKVSDSFEYWTKSVSDLSKHPDHFCKSPLTKHSPTTQTPSGIYIIVILYILGGGINIHGFSARGKMLGCALDSATDGNIISWGFWLP